MWMRNPFGFVIRNIPITPPNFKTSPRGWPGINLSWWYIIAAVRCDVCWVVWEQSGKPYYSINEVILLPDIDYTLKKSEQSRGFYQIRLSNFWNLLLNERTSLGERYYSGTLNRVWELDKCGQGRPAYVATTSQSTCLKDTLFWFQNAVEENFLLW
jgi:hypothetical protein